MFYPCCEQQPIRYRHFMCANTDKLVKYPVILISSHFCVVQTIQTREILRRVVFILVTNMSTVQLH